MTTKRKLTELVEGAEGAIEKMGRKMNRHEQTLSIDFLYGRDHFPQGEGIKAIQALPAPHKFGATFYCWQKEQYLDVTRAVIRLLAANGKMGSVSSGDHRLSTVMAMARWDFQAVDTILANVDVNYFCGKDGFKGEGSSEIDISAELPYQTQEDLVRFYSQPTVFKLLGLPASSMCFNFQESPLARGELSVNFLPGGDIDGPWTAWQEYCGYGGSSSRREALKMKRELKIRKIETWQSFLQINNYSYVKKAADPRLFEYAAAITESIINSKADSEYVLVLEERITRDRRKYFLLSSLEFQAKVDTLMKQYC